MKWKIRTGVAALAVIAGTLLPVIGEAELVHAVKATIVCNDPAPVVNAMALFTQGKYNDFSAYLSQTEAEGLCTAVPAGYEFVSMTSLPNNPEVTMVRVKGVYLYTPTAILKSSVGTGKWW